MRKNHILSALAMAAVTFGVTACADTDAQYTIPDVNAPQFVSSTPTEGANKVKRGEITINLKFDKRIFFASNEAEKITVTGATLSKALVYGQDSVLSVIINCPEREQNVNVTVPAGLVANGQGKTYDKDINVSFQTVGLDKTPVMATTVEAKKLYNFLLENVDTKTISGMMANVAWNHTCADQVNEWTGKYPAINGFDYVHMAASKAGANWINYKDITPVQEWADKNGIVQLMWHWNVPKNEPTATLDPNKDYAFYVKSDGNPNGTTFDPSNALKEGTWENEVWKNDMATLKEYLTLLKNANIPVLWRPFHEASGKWFWWGAKDAATFKTLWIEMFNELKEAGLDNLIWVWTSCGKDDDWYPGDAYVDIVARDLYGDKAETCASEFATLGSTYGNKIVTLGECGYSTSTKKQIATLSEQNEKGAKWSWFMVWYNDEDNKTFHSTQEWWQDAMSQPNIITRDQVPSMK